MSIRYAFYGDDFTGSTDVLEQLASNGIPTVLFLETPTQAELAMFPSVEAIGIAGDSRSRSPAWMSENLPAVFRYLATTAAPIVHYKVCSTFDSSPTHGSIGRAIEVGIDTLHPRFVPIVVGAPHLRRYVAFGNLFASAPGGEVVRIDCHPMADHPVTPMREADLRKHLRTQTEASVGLINCNALKSLELASASLESQRSSGTKVILFDTIDDTTQSVVGEVLWHESLQHRLFSASSSGLTAALIAAWRNAGILERVSPAAPIAPVRPLLVISGSCSPVTKRQILWALDHGFHGLALEPGMRSLPSLVDAAEASLNSGRDTILYTSLGPASGSGGGDTLGITLGEMLRALLTRTSVRRVLLCGGDTSSHAVQQLGLYALTWIANLQPGAPLCRAHAHDGRALELVLKGGQIGTDDFFHVVRGGF